MNFKRTIALLAVPLALFFQNGSLLADNPDIVSSRIGNAIDSQEREYFGLFPKIDNFLSASISSSGDSVVLRVVRAGASDTSFAVGANGVLELRTYIEDYEDLFRQQRQLRWELLQGIARPAKHMEDLSPIVVEDRGGREYRGQLISISPNTMALWNGAGPYDWRKINEHLIVLPWHALEHVETPDRWTSKWYVAAGGAIAGTLGSWYSNTKMRGTVAELLFLPIWSASVGIGLAEETNIDLPVSGNPDLYQDLARELSSRVQPESMLPPELVRAIAAHRIRDQDTIVPTSIDWILARYPRRRIHIGVEKIYSTMLAANRSAAIDLSSFGRPPDMSSTSFAPVPWGVNVEYNVAERFRVGAKVYFSRDGGSTNDLLDDHVTLHTGAVTTSYEIVPIDPLLRSRFELLGMLGVAYESWRVDGTERGNSPQRRDTVYRETGTTVGMLGSVRLGYYISRAYSAYFGLEGHLVPKVTVAHADDLLELKDYAREHSIDPSRISVEFGLQLHL